MSARRPRAPDNGRVPPNTDPTAERFAPCGHSLGEDPSRDDPSDPFEALVAAALDGLPAPFRDRLESVAVVIEDEPTPAQLVETGASGLLGLYTGVPRTVYGADAAAVASKITIFRGPHQRLFRTPDALARGVAETVRHEVAHHFGISDTRLSELGRQRGP